MIERKIEDFPGFHRLILEDIPVVAAEHLRETMGLTEDQFAIILGISKSTLRRMRESDGHLRLTAGDRLYRVARIFAVAVQVFGRKEKAAEWLCHPQRKLRGSVPLDLLFWYSGARDVEDVLERIKHCAPP